MDNARYLELEARALLTRLRQVQPFSANMPVVGAASVSRQAQQVIGRLLLKGRKKLRKKIHRFISLMRQSPAIPAEEMQTVWLWSLSERDLTVRIILFWQWARGSNPRGLLGLH